MCCFSRPVISVASTKIFARASDAGRQYLVYSMDIEADEVLAMVLPIPVAQPAKEDAVHFIDMQAYPRFFRDLDSGFPSPPVADLAPEGIKSRGRETLEVHDVGDFVASFVPTRNDFSRLDEQFRLADNVWDKLPKYRTYGFAVFQLKPGRQSVQPMAFEFPRADPNRLFFPTVHIHDGRVHRDAEFDHALYAQKAGRENFTMWEESERLAGTFMEIENCKGLIKPDSHCYKKELHGMLKNDDTWA